MPKSSSAAVPDVYILTHTFQGGESVNTIHYHPTEDAPYPDICAVAQKLLGKYYSASGGDCLQLIPVESEPDIEFLPTDGVGSRVFVEFHEGELNLEPKKVGR